MAYNDKNGGWEYLNSEEESSYHNADGSWGYIDSSGEGSYHGADGSWGYREKDGSISYHGADGSWGTRDADGSWRFRDADGNYSYHDVSSCDNDENLELCDTDTDTARSSSLGEAIGSIIGAGLGYLSVAALIQAEKEELRRKERAEERREYFRRHWKEIFGVGAFFVFAVAFFVGAILLNRSIPIGYDANELVGYEYSYVVRALNEAGFTKVCAEATEDLSIEEISEENRVYQIYILGKNNFTESNKYPHNTKILVKYHAIRLITLPFSAKETKGKIYTNIIEDLEEAGFINIKVEPQYDIVTGWLTEDGEIANITVDGEKRFSQATEYRPDVEIGITYHTLKKNKEI